MSSAAENFISRTKNWQTIFQLDEGFFKKLRDELLVLLSPEMAFFEIDGFVEIVLKNRDSYLTLEAGYIILALARKSNTSELPNSIRINWKEIDNILGDRNNFQELLREIKNWYRL